MNVTVTMFSSLDFIFLWLIRLIRSSYELGDNRNSLGQSQRAILMLLTLLDFITHQPLCHFTCSDMTVLKFWFVFCFLTCLSCTYFPLSMCLLGM